MCVTVDQFVTVVVVVFERVWYVHDGFTCRQPHTVLAFAFLLQDSRVLRSAFRDLREAGDRPTEALASTFAAVAAARGCLALVVVAEDVGAVLDVEDAVGQTVILDGIIISENLIYLEGVMVSITVRWWGDPIVRVVVRGSSWVYVVVLVLYFVEIWSSVV